MREITFKVPDQKVNLFLELAKQLGIEVSSEQDLLPDWQKEQLNKVLSDHNNGALNYSDWQEVKKELISKFIEK
ncbi:MAG: hypothetical protein RL331_121 [Bacteroidota bacterium]|jgi:uracil DNA glycosylase